MAKQIQFLFPRRLRCIESGVFGEQYLQSLISAPIKNNTEVCMFLSTDLVKEKDKRAPVSQPGYKEGYLTKRGKNFGGFVPSFQEHLNTDSYARFMDRWKTRYFVISGPVLEYYESVRVSPTN